MYVFGGRRLVGSDAITSSTPCLHTWGCLIGPGDFPWRHTNGYMWCRPTHRSGFGRCHKLFGSKYKNFKSIVTCLWGPSPGRVKCYYVQHLVLTHVRLFDRAGRFSLQTCVYLYVVYLLRRPTHNNGLGWCHKLFGHKCKNVKPITCIFGGRRLAGSDAITSGTSCLYTWGCLIGLGDFPLRYKIYPCFIWRPTRIHGSGWGHNLSSYKQK